MYMYIFYIEKRAALPEAHLLQSLSAPFFNNCSAHCHLEVCFHPAVAYHFPKFSSEKVILANNIVHFQLS